MRTGCKMAALGVGACIVSCGSSSSPGQDAGTDSSVTLEKAPPSAPAGFAESGTTTFGLCIAEGPEGACFSNTTVSITSVASDKKWKLSIVGLGSTSSAVGELTLVFFQDRAAGGLAPGTSSCKPGSDYSGSIKTSRLYDADCVLTLSDVTAKTIAGRFSATDSTTSAIASGSFRLPYTALEGQGAGGAPGATGH